jgi:hypothetical protein
MMPRVSLYFAHRIAGAREFFFCFGRARKKLNRSHVHISQMNSTISNLRTRMAILMTISRKLREAHCDLHYALCPRSTLDAYWRETACTLDRECVRAFGEYAKGMRFGAPNMHHMLNLCASLDSFICELRSPYIPRKECMCDAPMIMSRAIEKLARDCAPDVTSDQVLELGALWWA